MRNENPMPKSAHWETYDEMHDRVKRREEDEALLRAAIQKTKERGFK